MIKYHQNPYMQETHTAPPNFRRLLSSKLKSLTASGKLVKVSSSVHWKQHLMGNMQLNINLSMLGDAD